VFLARSEIERCIASGEMRVSPFSRDLLKPASYVLRLGTRFGSWRQDEEQIRPWSSHYGDNDLTITSTSDSVLLRPGQFILGATEEVIGLSPRIAGLLSTLSHLARCGLSGVGTSSWVSPGFGWSHPTALTLELVNHGNRSIAIEPGMPICHIACAYVEGMSDEEGPLRESVYVAANAPSAPKLLQEFSALKERG
jgi:dCTP deaminase